MQVVKFGPRHYDKTVQITFTKRDLYALRRQLITVYTGSRIVFRGKLQVMSISPKPMHGGEKSVEFFIAIHGQDGAYADIMIEYNYVSKAVYDEFGVELHLAYRSY